MPIYRTVRFDRPYAWARSPLDGLLVLAGSATLLSTAVGAVALVAPARVDAVVAVAQDEAGRLARQVEAWQEATGRTPHGLAQVTGAEPLDPWGHPWRLEVDDLGLVLVSLGADGAPGGVGVHADVRVRVGAAPDPTDRWAGA